RPGSPTCDHQHRKNGSHVTLNGSSSVGLDGRGLIKPYRNRRGQPTSVGLPAGVPAAMRTPLILLLVHGKWSATPGTLNHRGHPMRYLICLLLGLTCVTGGRAQQPAANTWVKLDKATVVGKRWDVPLGFAPDLKRFAVLGGRTTWADYKKPRSYD